MKVKQAGAYIAMYVNIVINEYKLWHNYSSYGHNIEHKMAYILSTALKHNTVGKKLSIIG